MKRNLKQFPNDENGEVLWRLRCAGDALTDPREIDFSAVFPDKVSSSEFASKFGKRHRVEIERLEKKHRDDGYPWHVLVYLDEIPTHKRITAFEALLSKEARSLGGRTWGWSATYVPSAEPIIQDRWWVYLASYDGLTGSTRLNFDLKDYAPMAGYKTLVVCGISCESSKRRPESGLPSRKELGFLHRISEKRAALVKAKAKAIHVGAFLKANRQEDFFYVADPKGLEAALKKFYKKECSGREHFFRCKRDPKWKAYLDFLYPNEATIEFYRKELEELELI